MTEELPADDDELVMGISRRQIGVEIERIAAEKIAGGMAPAEAIAQAGEEFRTTRAEGHAANMGELLKWLRSE